MARTKQQEQIRVRVDDADDASPDHDNPLRLRPGDDDEADLPDHLKSLHGAAEGRERRGQAEGPAVFRAECGQCGARINYAFARRAAIPGLCGRCHDRIRRSMRDELTLEILGGTTRRSRTRIVHFRPRRQTATALLAGIVLGFVGAVVLSTFRPDLVAPLAEHARTAVSWAGAQLAPLAEAAKDVV